MNKNTFFFMLILVLASSLPLFAQLRQYPDESLKGVKGVRVIVRYKGPVEDSYGLAQKKLQNVVESWLKADGVKVLTNEEWSREPGKPYLSITVVGTQVGSKQRPAFFYSIATDLIQEVSLSRRPLLKTEGSTWNQDYALVVPKNDLQEVLVKISDAAHDFAQSVREANK